MISEILRNALLQIYAPERLRGRLSSLYLAQVNTAPALGNTEAGIVAQLSSLTISVVSGGLACVAGALLLGALIPSLRNATLAGPHGGEPTAPGEAAVPEAADLAPLIIRRRLLNQRSRRLGCNICTSAS
jgi:ENTS family enterobactin (siderophore) exporter